jgi:hypothetical protein
LHKEGLSCPRCKKTIIPINIYPSKEDLDKVNSYETLKLLDKKNKIQVSDFLKRKGIIKISNSLINSDPILLLEVLKDFLAVKAENDFIKEEITYYGYSKYFDIVKDGEEIPEYIIIVTKEYTDEYESMNVRIEKVF